MEFELVDETEVPAKPKEMSKGARESLALINQLTPGKVARIKVAPDQMRSVKLSLSRVGSANGKKVTVYSDETYVYCRLAD